MSMPSPARAVLSAPFARLLAAGVGLVALAALGLQYALLLALPGNGGVLAATVRFFSYFTILSNVGVALVCLRTALGRDAGRPVPRLQGLVALSIGVTGLVYVTVLAALWQPQGLQWWADTALHRVVPLLYLGWWLGCVPHGALRWRDALGWLLFPLAYVLWVLVRGLVVHEVPYPFLDPALHGVAGVLRNALWVTLVFVALGALLVGVDRLLGRLR